MKKINFICFYFVVFLTNSYATNELEVCQFIKKQLATQLKINAKCTQKYLHFCSKKNNTATCSYRGKTEESGQLALAGFNVFNLGKEADFTGTRETVFKDIPLLSKVIGKWDLVSAIELKHFDIKEWQTNQFLLEEKPASWKKELHVPPYIVLLKELQKQDQSWSLILSTELWSNIEEDSLNNELAGVFYKQSKVSPIKTNHCNSVACVPAKSKFSIPLARRPFVSSFEKNGTPFTIVSDHIRYRPPTIRIDGKPKLDEEKMKRIRKELDIEALTKKNFKDEEVARFAEVHAISNYIQELEENSEHQNILFFGDFNLPGFLNETTPATAKGKRLKQAWDHALAPWPGVEIYIEDKTTLGKKELANNYDHFIFWPDSEVFSNCSHPEIFNFTSKREFPEAHQFIGKLTSEKILRPIKKKKIKKKKGYEARYTEGQLGFLERGTDSRILSPFKNGENGAFKELISDHLPIFMNCNF